MESKKFKALLYSVESGSLSSAANELGYTQSGLTHMVTALEKELGIELLQRGFNGVKLNDAGEALLPQIREFVRVSDELEAKINSTREILSRHIHVCAYSSMSRRWLPSVVAEFKKRFPYVDVSVTTGSIIENYDWISGNKMDCAFVGRQDDLLKRGIKWMPLKMDELLAVVSPAEYDKDYFDINDFDDKVFLMPYQGFDRDILPIFKGEGISPKIQYCNLDDYSIASMVSHGLGSSILSELISRDISENVTFLPFKEPVYRSLGMIVTEDKYKEKYVRSFIECAREVVSKMQ